MDSWQSIVNGLSTTLETHGVTDPHRIIFVCITALCHWTVFWGSNLFFFLCYKNSWFMKYRIQKTKELPSWELTKECLLHLIPNHFLIQPIALYFAYPLFVHQGLQVDSAIPSVFTICRDLFISLMLNDILFYMFHRLLHHKSIYKYIHKQHHKFTVTIGIAAEFAHPVEDVLANLIPTLGGCLLLGSHPGYTVYYIS